MKLQWFYCAAHNFQEEVQIGFLQFGFVCFLLTTPDFVKMQSKSEPQLSA